MALQQLKSASFSGYIPFSASPSGDVDFGSSNIQTCGNITAGNVTADSATFGDTSGNEVQISNGNVYADNVDADSVTADSVTADSVTVDGNITAGGASFGSCGAVTIDSCGNIDAKGSITANGASFGSCGTGTIDSCGNITAKSVYGCGLQLNSPGGTLLQVTPGSGSSQYYAMIRLTSGSVVKSGYICPDSQGVLHLESSIPYPTQA